MPPKKTITKKTQYVGKQKPQITKDSNLAEVVEKYPEIAEVLLDYGLHCVGCFASVYDTIEAGAQIHGLTSEEINEMVARLNEVIEFGE